MTPVDFVTTSQNRFWYGGAFSKWAFGKGWILEPRKELPAIRQGLGLNPKNHRRIWKFPPPPWWGPMPVPHQEHQPLSRREESLVWYLSNLLRCLQGVLGWIFMSICGFELNCQLHVISTFNICFCFCSFCFVISTLHSTLCSESSNKSISAFCTNFAFRRISFGFKQKRLFAKKSNMSSFVAFLSGADQYGRWVPSEEVTASAYLGGSTVDFSQALFKHPVPLRWFD